MKEKENDLLGDFRDSFQLHTTEKLEFQQPLNGHWIFGWSFEYTT